MKNAAQKIITLLWLLATPALVQGEILQIRAIGDSTSCGLYNEQAHRKDADASIPLMVKEAVESYGIKCVVEDLAVSATSVDWQLGRKDGDELTMEPKVSATPPASTYELAKSKANVVTIQMGINDAGSNSSYSFMFDFYDLVLNCKRTGKKIYINMPNSVLSEDNDNLKKLATVMENVGNFLGATVVNTGLQEVSMNDERHPNPGPAGYEALGQALKDAVAQEAQSVLNHLTVTRYYVAMFHKTPEKDGLDYWANDLNSRSRDQVAQDFVNIVEGISGAMTDIQFLTLIYKNAMHRVPDAGGLSFWTNEIKHIGGPYARGAVLNEILDTLVNGTATSGGPFIDQSYLQNYTSVGFAYGYIYGKKAVTPINNLDDLGVTNDFNSVYLATSRF